MQRSQLLVVPRRAAAVAAVLAVALVARGLAAATGEGGWWPSTLLRGDAGDAVAIALGTMLLQLPWARARAEGTDAPRWRREVLPLVWRTYLVWWIALAVTILAGNAVVSPARVIAQALVFRHPGSAGPPPDLAIGWVLAVLLPVALLTPFWGAVVRRLAGGSRGILRAELMAAGALVALGLLIRLAGLVDDSVSPFGPLSLLPGQLHLVGVGLAGAALVGHGRTLTPRQGVAAAAALVVAIAVGVAALDDMPLQVSTGDRALQVVLHLVIAAAVVALLLVRRPAPAPLGTVSRRASWTVGALAVVGPAMLVLAGPSLGVIARQYRERFALDPTGTGWHLDGGMIPPFLWAVLLALALALTVRMALEVPLAGLLRDRRLVPSWGWWLAGIAGAGFVWRVVTLLTIAPERTDGGDPLFYHITANLIAQGRGFPEPLNWTAYATSIPSALHGPLYPVYLSIYSRLGATTFFDQKMASIVVGTLTIVVAGFLGRRIGGRGAGLAAAVLVAAYPHLWLIDGVMFPEGLMVLMCGIVMLCAYRWRDRHGVLAVLGLGGFIGMAALARGEGLFLAVLLAIPWIMLDKNLALRRRMLHLVLAGLACVAVLAPWTVYNLPRFEVFVPLSTNGNELHVYSNCDDTYSGKFLGFWVFDCQTRLREVQGEPPGDEAEKAVYWRTVGFDYAKDHAGELPKVVAARVLRQWDLFRPFQNAQFAAIEGRSVGAAQVGLAMYWLMLPFAVWGVVASRRRRVPTWPLVAQAVSVTITAAYAYGTTRFRAPAELSLCVLAAVGMMPVVTWAWKRLAPDGVPRRIGGRDAFVVGGDGGWRRGSSWLALGAVAALVALPVRGLYRAIGSTMEEGFMLVFPERVRRGDVPNVDFLHLYGPGSLDVLAAVYAVFGTHLAVQRTVGLVQHLAIIAAIFVIARAWGRGIAVVSASVCALFVLTPIGLSALAWNGGVALGLWAVVVALRARHSAHPSRWWAGAGLLAGLALTYRPDVVTALALALLWLLWSERARWKVLLGGLVVGLIPMWVHLVRAGIGPAFEGMVLDPVVNLRPGRELPRPPSWGHLDGALQVIGENVAPRWPLPALAASQQLYIWFFVLPVAALAVLAVAIVFHRRGGARVRTRVLLAAGLFGLGLVPQAMQRPDSAHLAWVSMVVLALVPPAAAEVLGRLRPTWRPLTRTLGIGLAAVVGLAVLSPFYTYRPYVEAAKQSLGRAPIGLSVNRNDRNFYIGDMRTWQSALEVVDALDLQAKPGERLLVGPVDLRHTVYSDVFFYHLFPELVPATPYIEMDPGLANAPGSSLADDVRSADWLLLTRYWSGWIEPNESVVFGPDDPNVVVENEFCLVGSYQRDLVRLYQRCEGGGAPGPYEGPYDPSVDYAVEVSVPVPPRSDGTHPPGSPAAPPAEGTTPPSTTTTTIP